MFETKDETEITSPLQIMLYTYWILVQTIEIEKSYNNREAVEDAAEGTK